MKTPFNVEQFIQVFKNYNLAVLPAQIIILLAGIFCTVFLFTNSRLRTRLSADRPHIMAFVFQALKN